MVTQEINLNLIPGGVPPVVNVSQYDKGSRVLKMHLYLGTEEYQIPDGAGAYIQGTKLDGTAFLYECEWSGNTVTADVTDQMTVVPGAVKCEVFLQEETEKRIATANFVIVVERTALQDNEKFSETEIPLIGTLAEAAVKAVQAQNASEKSEGNADQSAEAAAGSEKNAAASEKAALASQNAAAKSESNAKTSEQNAATSEKNAKASETAAAKSAEAAAQSASNLSSAVNTAKSYAVGGTGTRIGEDTDNAKYYAEEAEKSNSSASASQKASADSQSAAGKSETNAAASAKAALASQNAAKQSETNAKTSADNAATSEKNAKASESAAAKSAEAAAQSASDLSSAVSTAQSYAVGGTDTRTGEDTDNAKYYAAEAEKSSSSASASQKASADSQSAAEKSAENAASSAKAASDSQSAAAQSESNAKTSADNAAVSEKNAKASESNAKTYSNQAADAKDGIEDAENKAQSYAVGGTGTRTGEDTDNAKYYASEAKNAAQEEKGNDLLQASGTVIEVDNSAEAPVHKLVIEGRSSQQTYTGKNLLDLTKCQSNGAYGLTTTIEGNVLHLQGTYSNTNAHAAFTVLIGTSDLYTEDSKVKSFAMDSSLPTPTARWTQTPAIGSIAIDITLEEGKTYDIPFQVMVYEGDEPTEYEPFVGGKASPNPDYPQEISFIDSLDLYVSGRNLLDKEDSSGISWANGQTDVLDVINALPVGIYTLSAHAHIDSLVDDWTSETETAQGPHFNLKNSVDSGYQKGTSETKSLTRAEALGYEADPYYVFAVTEENAGKFSNLWAYGCGRHTKVDGAPNGPCGYATFSKWSIVRESTVQDYEESVIKHVAETFGYELCSLPDGTHDEFIINEDGSCSIIKRVGKVVFDGSDDEIIWKYSRYYYLLMPSLDYDGYVESDDVGISSISDYQANYGHNCLWVHQQSSGDAKNKVCLVTGAELTTNWESVDALRSYLQSSPVTVYYKINEKEIPLTITEDLSTHNPYTILWDTKALQLNLQYYSSTAQGTQDQVKNLKADLAAEIRRAQETENVMQTQLDKTKSVYGVTEIARESDLNALLTPGEYVLPHAADASSIANSPVSTAFRVTVESQTTSENYLVQTLRPFNSTDIYRRQTTNKGDTWSAWVRLVNSADLKQSVGTLVTHQEFIVDNDGHLKYLTLFDITDWFTADADTVSIATRSFTGILFADRGNGYIGRNAAAFVRMGISYTKSDSMDSMRCLLETGDKSYTPCILHDSTNEKYYLAIRISASSITLWLFGAFHGTYVGEQILTTDSNGTMPDGWSEETGYVANVTTAS